MTAPRTTQTPIASVPSALFFFFGSLRQGYWNNALLSKDAVFLGPARTVAPFKLFIGKNGSVPTCQPNAGEMPMQGELYALNPRDASNVYRLETGYEHAIFQVVTEDGKVHDATIFHHTNPATCWYLGGEPVVIETGNYADVIAQDGGRRRQAQATEASI